MASVPDVVGLLYRADWTRLSLSAEVNTGFDPSLHLKSVIAARPRWPRSDPPEPHDRIAGSGSQGFAVKPRSSAGSR